MAVCRQKTTVWALYIWSSLMAEMRAEDITSFFNYLRMSPKWFDELLHWLTPRPSTEDTNFRKALEPGLKLAVTIRHLASGDKYPSLSYGFRVSRHTIANFQPQVCRAIVQEYEDEVITCSLLHQANGEKIAENLKGGGTYPLPLVPCMENTLP